MAPTANAYLITVDTGVAMSTNTLPKLRPAPLTAALLKGAASPARSSSGYASSSYDNMEEEEGLVTTPPKAKKRRLDHLTWEEKVQRKKLKNRVAAQTSRDRKKARMEEMEYEIKELTDKTELMQNKCESLQSINESLLAKNQKLDAEVELLRQELEEMKEQQKQQQQQHAKNITCNSSSNANIGAEGCASTILGSAASNADPLQQGTHTVDTQSSARLLTEQLKSSKTMASLWKVVALCLLYKTCCSSTTKSSTRGALKNWPKVCSQISQQTWKLALERAAQLLPKIQATKSDCLDQWWGPQQSAWNPAAIELMAS